MRLKRLAFNLAIALLLTLGVAYGAISILAVRAEAAAEAAYPPQGRILDVDGARVHAVVLGDGPDVVLIHGSSGSTRDMTFTLAPLLAQSFRVIVMDRPGLGYSDRIGSGGASIAEQAAHLQRAASRLGADRPIVVGQSYGGAVALAWAVHRPDALAGLVPLAAPSNPWSAPLDPLYRVTSTWWGRTFVVPAITAFTTEERIADALVSIFEPQTAPDGYRDRVGAALSLRREAFRETALQRKNLLDEITALHDRYGEVSVPTEILHGTADTIVGLSIHSDKLVGQIPDAQLDRLDGIGHMLHHVATDAVTAAIDRVAAAAGLR
jgi:pimeloyl-ACP methyl ester carboxylesterase